MLFLMPVTKASTIPATRPEPDPVPLLYKKMLSLKARDIEKLTGEKLTIKEKIGLWVLKKKIKRHTKENKDQGQAALVFGIAGAVLLVLGLFVPYVILGSLVAAILAIVLGSVARKKDPSDKKAFAGKLLGWLTLGLIALLILAVAIAISGWGWG